MGRLLVRAALADPALALTGASVRPGSPHDGADAGLLSGHGVAGVLATSARDEALEGAQVVVSFTPPEVCLDDVAAAARIGIPSVVGTTGWELGQRERLEALAVDVPVLLAPNFSIGVWVLTRLVEDAARRLEGFDVELVELHHKHKADAPSGTALQLGAAAADGRVVVALRPAADGRGVALDDAAVFAREGRTGPRPEGAIGLQTLRGGDATGEHTVLFLGEGERVELTHRTSSRAAFVGGALRAAKWIVGRPAGLYGLGDVLG